MSQNHRRPYRGRSNNSRRHNNGGRKGPKKEFIHPSKLVKQANFKEAEVYKPQHNFEDFPLDNSLKQNIRRKGFTTPSPIQDQIIPSSLDGSNVLGIANTGTGKTVAFAIPVIQRILSNRNSKAIVLAPTRELAEQVLEEFKTLLQGTNVNWALLIGGAGMGKQFRDLDRRPSIVIGTPGRVKDHIERKRLKLSHFDTVVLDEVDRMLDMGFVHDMREILSLVSPQRQSYFFSATMNPRVRSLIDEFADQVITVSVKTGDTSDNVEQNIVDYIHDDEKIDKLHDLLIKSDENKVLIFDDRRRDAERLSKALQERGFRADSIHGGKSQGQRRRALSKFKSNDTKILVATDVAARGIDVADITHVINYSMPQSYEDYVHRIGRAGRAGRKGNALTFVKAR